MLNDFPTLPKLEHRKPYDRAVLKTILRELVERLTDDAIDNLHGAGTFDEIVSQVNAPRNYGEDSRDPYCEICCKWENDHDFGCPVAALAAWSAGETETR